MAKITLVECTQFVNRTFHAGDREGFWGSEYGRPVPGDLSLTASLLDHDPDWDPREDRTTITPREQERRDFFEQLAALSTPEHKAMFKQIDELGEAPFGLTAYLQGPVDLSTGKHRGISFFDRQIVEDVHLSGSGDVLRPTGIDRDPRKYHLRPLSVSRAWQVSGADAVQLADDLAVLNAPYDISPQTMTAAEVHALAEELRAVEAMPDEDALSGAVRYFDDTDPERHADDDDDAEVRLVEGDDEQPDMHGADRGFEQYVSLDDPRDESYRDRITGEIIFTHPACPWSLKQPRAVQDLGRRLKNASTQEALKDANNDLVGQAQRFTKVQKAVLWGIFHRSKARLFRAKWGAPSPKAGKWIERLKDPRANLGKAGAAIRSLPPGADRVACLEALRKASWKQSHA